MKPISAWILSTLITISLAFLVIVLPGMPYTWLMLLAVSAIWVAIDVDRLKKTGREIDFPQNSIAALLVILGFWLFAFPFYLAGRLSLNHGRIDIHDLASETEGDPLLHKADEKTIQVIRDFLVRWNQLDDSARLKIGKTLFAKALPNQNVPDDISQLQIMLVRISQLGRLG